MPLANLDAPDRETVRRCIIAAADGPFFEDWEFQTLFGLTRDEVRAVAAAWPPDDTADEHARLAINGAMNNLTGYPHGLEADVARLCGMTVEHLRGLYSRWRMGTQSTA